MCTALLSPPKLLCLQLLCFQRRRATYRRYATSTNMSREAFGEEVLVYANLNNWGGRFITPGPFDNTSRIFFVSHASVAAMLGATQWSS